MKTDDYFDQREELQETPPWTEDQIECADLAEAYILLSSCKLELDRVKHDK